MYILAEVQIWQNVVSGLFCPNNIPDIVPKTGGTLSLYPYFPIEKINHFTYN